MKRFAAGTRVKLSPLLAALTVTIVGGCHCNTYTPYGTAPGQNQSADSSSDGGTGSTTQMVTSRSAISGGKLLAWFTVGAPISVPPSNYGFAVHTATGASNPNNKVLLLVNHDPVGSDNASGFHGHIWDLLAPGGGCPGADAQVTSLAGYPLDSSFAFAVQGSIASLSGQSVSNLGGGTVKELDVVQLTPLANGFCIKNTGSVKPGGYLSVASANTPATFPAGTFNLNATTAGNIPVSGKANGFGYAYLSNGLSNVLVLVTHNSFVDETHQQFPSGLHTHVLNLKSASTNCPGYELEVDLVTSPNNTAFDPDYTFAVSGTGFTITGIPTKDLNAGSVTMSAPIPFVLSPIFGDGKLINLCVHINP